MRLPSPAMIVAILALLIAVTGTSWAAISLPKDSVGPTAIKDGAVRSPEVKNGALMARDFARGQLPAGPKGDPGATNVIAREQSGPQIVPGATDSVGIACEKGERVTGGGGGFAGPPTLNDRLVESIPVGAENPPTKWRITLFNGGETPRTAVAYAICAAP